jgi:putative endonuclease
MSLSKKDLGNKGEEIAVQYLRKNKYKITARHYQKRIGEIDVIAFDPQNVLVFFEVKTRTTHRFGTGAESVNWAKQRKLIKAAYFYLLENHLQNQNFRIDVIAVDLNPQTRQSKVTHYRNAVGE